MSTLPQSTILVTGGAGFIGSCLVRQLVLCRQVRVVTLDKLTYCGNLASLESVLDRRTHVFVQGDVCDRGLLHGLFDEFQPDAVVHLAAESHVDRSITAPDAFIQTNVCGTFELLQAAREYHNRLPTDRADSFRFLQVSTDEVYGSLGAEGQFTETTAYAPNSPYSASKAAADHFVRAYFSTYGLPVLITHCSNNYGPYQYPEKLIPVTVQRALAGQPIPVYGDGQNVRDWVFVEDHVRALWQVLQYGQPGATYDIGGSCERTNLEVVRTICDIVDHLHSTASRRPCEDMITFVTDRPGHDRRYAVDAGKIRRQLGWFPRESFKSGLERTVGWYARNRQWVDAVTERR